VSHLGLKFSELPKELKEAWDFLESEKYAPFIVTAYIMSRNKDQIEGAYCVHLISILLMDFRMKIFKRDGYMSFISCRMIRN